ncbi:hypothetical protein LJC10_02440 [Selenomonadales bacterium OttesenSCG-928-I06]|nr:hypothetical protein [Selenomonadales bacterium OttesenSCG-928-I06]
MKYETIEEFIKECLTTYKEQCKVEASETSRIPQILSEYVRKAYFTGFENGKSAVEIEVKEVIQ